MADGYDGGVVALDVLWAVKIEFIARECAGIEILTVPSSNLLI